MAVEDTDENNPTGIQLLMLDYPYAIDGLEIWTAIKSWVNDFCSLFYKDDEAIIADVELQAWWSEIRFIGHGDNHNETWWYQMTTLSNLVEALTTLIWISSARQAVINHQNHTQNGNYQTYYPTLCKKFIPLEGTVEFGEFLKDPDKFFMKMLPNRFEISLGLALVDLLSKNAYDEMYLLRCQPSHGWIDNELVQNRFAEFREELKEIQIRILQRNKDPKLKNRRGSAKIDHNILYPKMPSSGSRRWNHGKRSVL
jgi:lipoxygenase